MCRSTTTTAEREEIQAQTDTSPERQSSVEDVVDKVAAGLKRFFRNLQS
jgi:hypothetical protein